MADALASELGISCLGPGTLLHQSYRCDTDTDIDIDIDTNINIDIDVDINTDIDIDILLDAILAKP